MPELPDITVYIDAMNRFLVGRRLERIDLHSLFLVRTFEPQLEVALGKTLQFIRRIGKRVVWQMDGDLFLVFHLMIAGRFHWKKPNAKPVRKNDLAAFHFENGTLMLTEYGSKKRAALHVVHGEEHLATHNPGGIEVLKCKLIEFQHVLRTENRTLKRALTDPHLISGIGNAYSDEILHAARLSPVRLKSQLSDAEMENLFDATRKTLIHWTQRLTQETGDGFPEKVTAFRKGMKAHGRFGQPCPDCKTLIHRIVYVENETNYCPKCQTSGKILADRSMSRLLKQDWPRRIETSDSE